MGAWKGENIMVCGKYRVIEEIYMFDCVRCCQLRIGEGTTFEIKDNGLTGYTKDFSFPSALLRRCGDYIERIYE